MLSVDAFLREGEARQVVLDDPFVASDDVDDDVDVDDRSV